MAGVLLRDQFLCEFDGEGYYLSEIDAHRVNLPDAGEGVEVRIIPDGRMNNIQYGDSFIRLSMNDARLLAQAILSVAFEPVRVVPANPGPGVIYTDSMGEKWLRVGLDSWAPAPPQAATVAEPEPPDLLGPEPPVGRLPADPRADIKATWDGMDALLNEHRYFNEVREFTTLDTDALPRVDGPTIGGEHA